MDLELVPTEDLINELLTRHDHAVFAGLFTPVDGTVQIRLRWKGNTHTCVGLATDVGDAALEGFYSEAEQ
jgi:hypothetical protein